MAKNSSTTSSTPKVAEEKVSRKRIAFPGIGAKTGYPFETIPPTFDFSKHKPLGKKNFKDGTVGFLEFKAAQLRFSAAKLTAKAADYDSKIAIDKQFGSPEQRKIATKYANMRKQLAEMEKSLQADGVDTAKL